MKRFTEHPRSVGETYFQHMQSSFGFGLSLFIASFACFIHAVFPFLCVRTGSSTVQTLHRRMVTHRARTPQRETRARERVDA
ncbi:MAG: DUF6356 family protein [Pseudomonadota bacterium]